MCENCPYNEQQHLNGTIYFNGGNRLNFENNNSETLLVFQAPGVEEWKNGEAIHRQVNKRATGSRIAKSWELTDRVRANYDITNVVQCFPGKYKNGRDKKPRKLAIKKCMENLSVTIAEKNYRRIILFGKVAQDAFEELDNLGFDEGIIERVKHPSGGLSNNDLNDLW
jgi:uracil-DNA glycosylase